MNPALTPLSRIKEMTNTELVAFAKEHSHLTILEREFLNRIERRVEADTWAKEQDNKCDVQSIVKWAKRRMEDGRS